MIPRASTLFVIPAKAGTQCRLPWVPAFAGMTRKAKYRVFNHAAAILFSLGVLSGCDFAGGAVLGGHGEMRGMEFDPPLAKPSFVFPTADGKMYDFRKETDGDVTLVFFGYTHCPDICPVHMSNIMAVLKKMSESDVRRIHVLFITTDPVRDTEQRLSEWLKAIDPRIIGLRPKTEDAIRVQSELGIQPALVLAPKPGHEGNYDVSHAAQVVAFTPDNLGRVAYASGTRQTDWAHDIPLLLKTKAK